MKRNHLRVLHHLNRLGSLETVNPCILFQYQAIHLIGSCELNYLNQNYYYRYHLLHFILFNSVNVFRMFLLNYPEDNVLNQKIAMKLMKKISHLMNKSFKYVPFYSPIQATEPRNLLKVLMILPFFQNYLRWNSSLAIIAHPLFNLWALVSCFEKRVFLSQNLINLLNAIIQ